MKNADKKTLRYMLIILLIGAGIIFSHRACAQTIPPAFRGEILNFSTVNDTTFLVTVSVNDESGIGNGSDIAADGSWVIWYNCRRYVLKNFGCGSCYQFSSEIKVEVVDRYANGSPGFGFCNIIQETNGIGAYVSGIQSGLQQCVLQYYTTMVSSGAGIDSSLVRNDSVFLATTEGEVYSGIAANTSFDGRILYVTKQGNNGTAVIGNYFKPFLTIQGAITAASDGDLIVVYPGIYIESTNLGQKNNINLFFFSKAQCSGCIINTVTSNANISITGNGIFTDFVSPFFLQGSGFVAMEFDSLSGGQAIQYSAGTRLNFNLRARSITTTGRFLTGSVKDTSVVDKFAIEVDYLKSANMIFGSPPNTMYSIYIKTLENTGLDIISWYQNNLNRTSGYVRIDNIIDSYVGAEHIFFQLLDAASRNINDIKITFSVGSYRGNGNLITYIRTLPASPNSYVHFHCDACFYTDTLSFLFEKGSVWPMDDSKYNINVTGNYFLTTNGSFLDVTTNTPATWNPRLFLSGNFDATQSNKEPFRFKAIGANKVVFTNSKILTSSPALAPITATSASSILTMNTFSNSTTINANVTEVIQPIIRNTNVK